MTQQRLLHVADLAVVSVDVHGILQLDCLGLDWYQRWLIAVAVVPVCLLAVVGARWLWQRRRAGTDRLARTAALQEGLSAGFFVVLLLYPRVSSKIFALLRCQWLGPRTGPDKGPAVLEEDFRVDCMSEQYHWYETAAKVLVVLIPIGVPLFALVVLLRAARRTALAAAGHDENTIERSGDDDEDENARDDQEDRTLRIVMEPDDTAEDLHGRTAKTVHAALSRQFGFLVDDYRPECYWYEPVDLLRKLALTSLLQVSQSVRLQLARTNLLRLVNLSTAIHFLTVRLLGLGCAAVCCAGHRNAGSLRHQPSGRVVRAAGLARAVQAARGERAQGGGRLADLPDVSRLVCAPGA